MRMRAKEIILVQVMVKKYIKMINKKGLSGVVTVVILVALSVALVAVVWGVVQNMIESRLDQAGSCSSLFTEKVVELNNDYTCYNNTHVHFAISVGNVEVDAILVKVEASSQSKTYRLDSSSSDDLTLYSGGPAEIPDNNAGLTYVLDAISEGLSGPYNIGVVPVINGNTCDEISRINAIDNCELVPEFP